jgi:hypothetical protein
MDEVEAVHRMVLVFDATVHVYTTAGAFVALDRRGGVDDLQLARLERASTSRFRGR